jgi:hypothetical protein
MFVGRKSAKNESDANEYQTDDMSDEIDRAPKPHGRLITQQDKSHTHIVELASSKEPRTKVVVFVVAFA